jgi:hypothetical protein
MITPQAPSPTAESEAAYAARWRRVMDTVALRRPDRMPVALYPMFWLARYGGISYRELMYDYERTKQIGERAVLELDPDIYSPTVMNAALGPSLEAIGYKQVQWPGHGVGDNQPYQYLDREYMKAEEYDEFLFDPTGFYLRKYLPRVAGAFEGLEQMPVLPGLHYFRLVGGIHRFARPAVRKAMHDIVTAAEEVERWIAHHLEFTNRMKAHGYPLAYGSAAISPYDFIADYFRGATGMMKDLYRHQDKLLLVLDKSVQILLSQTIATAKASGNPIVFIPVHWAGDTFMSPKQFETFWWPPCRKYMLGLIEAGLIPMPLWEADCTRRLETIRDIPAGKCIYWFERTDMVRAFEVLGDVVALRGNLSASLMTTGTPDAVDAAVKRLVDEVYNKGGSLILDTAFGIPDEAPVDNVRAMYAAARKYGS